MLLVLMALVAVGIGGEQMRKRRARYLESSIRYRELEASILRHLAWVEATMVRRKREAKGMKDYAESAQDPNVRRSWEGMAEHRAQKAEEFVAEEKELRRMAEDVALLKRKYEHAASHPWEMITPE